MFLKTLTLKGFKSFAESTTLKMEPGVTVVVGPNGSGKSNIVDAIGWVLGAQAPSTVRSSKMDDVIFAGTAKKAALGRAEVALTIDNSSGLLPIEFTEVTITRTLFRSGDSEYAINGVPCRLLDVQELLSDTGMGRQRHIIISQGQIDAVLNARPEERRLVVEEAAGVLKFRRRKEKAERRLTATEANLTRLEDLRREVARELRPLERQADAARRHQGLADELRALRIHLSGRDLRRLRTQLATTATRSAEASRRETELLAALARLDAELLAAESVLLAAGGQDLADALGRCDSLREKARGQRALVAERRRRLEGDVVNEMDSEVIVTLEAEAAQVADEITAIESERSALGRGRSEIDDAVGDLEAARVRFAEQWDDSEGPSASRAAEVRGELAALQAAQVRGAEELERVLERLATARTRVSRLDGEGTQLTERAQRLDDELPVLTRKLEESTARVTRDVAAADAATQASRDAEASLAAWTARAETIESALDGARARAGVEHLAALQGVVGTLLDVVEIDDGFQAAFEAAAGEAIAAVVVRGVSAARRALRMLLDGQLDGSVLALEVGGGGVEPAAAAPGTERLRGRVRGLQPGVDALLDVLVGNVLVATTWTGAVEAVVARPGSLVVTTEGGRFAPTGWRVATDSTGATGAALERARDEAARAVRLAEAARTAASEQASKSESARDNARNAQRAVDEASTELTSLQARIGRAGGDHDEARRAVDSLHDDEAQLRATLAQDAARVASLEAMLPEIEAEEARLAEESRRRGEAHAEIEARAVDVATRRSNLDARVNHLDERLEALRRRAAEIEDRLARDDERRRNAEQRRGERVRAFGVLVRIDAVITASLDELDLAAEELRRRRRLQTDKVRAETELLERLRARRSRTETELTECRNTKETVALEATEARVRAEQVVEALRVELDADPEAALSAPCPELAENVTPIARVRELERELRRMGTINPLAVAEFEEKTERHEFLAGQLEDVRGSRRELDKVIREVDAQIAGTFTAAFADVRENFIELFQTLFPGGAGDLTLTDPEHPLDTGVEIAARPSGKNVRTLSLLSGGERSLVALAFLFAVFRSRSSPFYVMDEVEAALDDVNLHRFLDLVAEFRSTAQLIIVSHQKRTMEAADALFGVTMQPGGASKVVSERARSIP
ncbi:MAG TPA: chromosome segregation protein SMC [Acidimicrobiales bacterium]|nr:chromosome segregation protein SMC [Acidimicrobiales bacterium]